MRYPFSVLRQLRSIGERAFRTLGDWAYRSAALNQLDLKLRRYLDFDGGFFVEAGANDGLAQTNTLFLQRRRQWTGLLVEPVPELAAACRKNRPGCLVEEVALVPATFKEPYIEMRYCNLMSLVKGAMKSDAEELEHVRVGAEVQKVKPRELKVATATLSSLLDKHHKTRVDFLSLDVEGFEKSVLEGLDLTRHRPTFMLIEARYRAEVEAVLGASYRAVDALTERDILYRVT